MKALFTFYFLLFTVFAFSQTAPAIEWQNDIGGNLIDEVRSVQQTADGGYIVGGYSTSGISGDMIESILGLSDYWILKLNTSGNIEWQIVLGGSSYDNLGSVMQTADGGYIVAGTSSSGISGEKTIPLKGGGSSDIWLIKLNASGGIEWQRDIGGSLGDGADVIHVTADGGYIIGGSSNSDISFDKTASCRGHDDLWIVKTDSLGNIEWDKTLGGNGDEVFNSVYQTTDGGYIVGGTSASAISGDKTENNHGYDFWIIKLNNDGSIQWQNTIGGSDYDNLATVIQTADGGYLAGGKSGSHHSGDKTENSIGHSDYWIVKLDVAGNVLWDNTIGGAQDDELEDLIQTADGGYVLAGQSLSLISGDKTVPGWGFPAQDWWVLKVDSSGIIIWQKIIGGTSGEIFQTISQTGDGGLLLGGTSWSMISGDKIEDVVGGYSNEDLWIVKLFPEEIPVCTSAPDDLFADHITTTKSKLHWDADAGAIKYKVQYKQNTSPVWTTINSSGNVKTLTGLTPNTLYKYRVRSTCSDVLSSPWSGIQTFTTLPLRESVLDQQMEVNIYPNPNTGTFEISVQNLAPASPFFEGGLRGMRIEIYNSLGQLIYSQQLNSPNNNFTETITLDNVSSGIYLMKIIGVGNEQKQSFIIQ